MPTLGLMYHDVVAGDPSASGFRGPGPDHYKVPRDRFERHLDAIAASGLPPSLVGERREPALFLTFDDGGRSAITDTAPLLERRGWRAHFFVTTDRIGTPGFLSREEVRLLHEAGHVVGSHACTHRPLTGLDDAEVLREWRESRTVLEELLDAPATVASVPTGRYTAREGRLAAEVGYEHLFTIEPWVGPRPLAAMLVHGRFSVYANTSARRIAALCALSRPTLLWMGGGWYARKAAKAVLGPLYDPLRRRALARLG